MLAGRDQSLVASSIQIWTGSGLILFLMVKILPLLQIARFPETGLNLGVALECQPCRIDIISSSPRSPAGTH
jgi:hypothetical protein